MTTIHIKSTSDPSFMSIDEFMDKVLKSNWHGIIYDEASGGDK